MSLILYHNPRCSKSRQAKALLDERGIDYDCVEYPKNPPDRDTLARLATTLEAPVAELVRTGDAAFGESGHAAGDLDDVDTVVTLLVDHPELMQRPILYDGTRTIIGRPPENVLSLLD